MLFLFRLNLCMLGLPLSLKQQKVQSKLAFFTIIKNNIREVISWQDQIINLINDRKN